MKRLLIIALVAVALVGCSKKEAKRNENEEVNTASSTVPAEALVETPAKEESNYIGYDVMGHIVSGNAPAIKPESKIETGEITEVKIAEEDGEFYGQSGRWISDTCLDKNVRETVRNACNAFLVKRGITDKVNYYIATSTIPDTNETIYYAEIANGEGLLWLYPGDDDFKPAEDVYNFIVYRGDITKEEADKLMFCDYMFPQSVDDYFFTGYITKNEDGTFTIENTTTGESISMTREELEVNAEYGAQNNDY